MPVFVTFIPILCSLYRTTNYICQNLCQRIVMTDPFGVIVSKLNSTFVNPTLKSSLNISILDHIDTGVAHTFHDTYTN